MTTAAILAAETLDSACGQNPGVLCRTVFNLTHSAYLAGSSEVIFGIPFKVILILVIAIVARFLLNRVIGRLVRRAATGQVGMPRLGGRGGRQLPPAYLPERLQQRAETVGSVLRSVVTLTVFGIAFVTILGTIGIDLAPIVASAGIIGIAVGFGAQNLVRDFLTGMFMILEDQFGVGDVIDAGPATGTVEYVGLRTTRLRDVNGAVWHIRNGSVTRIGNMSQGWARAVLDVPVSHATDVARARAVIAQVADGVWRTSALSADILEEPEVWGVEQMTAEGIVIRLVVKTAPLRQWAVARELRERLKVAFDVAGLEFPQTAPAPQPAPPAGAPASAPGTPGAPGIPPTPDFPPAQPPPERPG